MNFLEWFKENWMKAGGLISSSNAARILACSEQYINQLTREGKLRKYPLPYDKHGRQSLISFNDVMDFNDKRTERKKKKIASKEARTD